MNELFIHLGWFNTWRDMVREARKHEEKKDFQIAAQMAQAEFVMAEAVYFAGIKA